MQTQDNRCKRCGLCCQAIPFAGTKQKLKECRTGEAKFLIKHWKRITRFEAEKINPHNKTRGKGCCFYACDLFNKTTQKCTIHANKPRVCAMYPWYGGLPDANVLINPNCGYLVDCINLKGH